MNKFTTLTGVAAPLPIDNVDTDMIIPKQYLKTIKRTGLGPACSPKCATGTMARKIPISFSTGQPTERRGPGGGRQFRLRLVARARALGPSGLRRPLRDFDLFRRHLLQQLLQERHPADQGLPARTWRS